LEEVKMRRLGLVLLGTTLVGCFNYESFQRRQIVEACQWAEKCGAMSQSTVSECVDTYDGEIKVNSTCDNFNSAAASSCLDMWEGLSCTDVIGLISAQSCADVCSN
jgi:hypothetical protein